MSDVEQQAEFCRRAARRPLGQSPEGLPELLKIRGTNGCPWPFPRRNIHCRRDRSVALTEISANTLLPAAESAPVIATENSVAYYRHFLGARISID